jgi:hypothetical protein
MGANSRYLRDELSRQVKTKRGWNNKSQDECMFRVKVGKKKSWRLVASEL